MPTSQKLQKIADTIATECLAVRVRILNRVITAIYDDLLRPFGLTVNQFNMLAAISKIRKPTAKSVARILKMETSTVSRNLERMKNQGWITIRGQDGRTQELGITSGGARRLEKAFTAWRKAQARTQAILQKEGSSMLNAIVESIWAKAGD
jgi:DNA-binding MarR family transcriptional regulator